MPRLPLALLAALAVAVPAAAQPGAVRVAGAAADGRVVRLHPGQRLAIAVEGCVGCPYAWEASAVPPNLSAEGTREIVHTPPGMVGGNKTVEFRFRARRPGRGVVELHYRPFAPGGSAARTLRVTVVTG